MNIQPWTIIGWLLLIVAAIFALRFLLALFAVVLAVIYRHVAYLKTRNTPMAEGQEWIQGDSTLVIGHKYPAGHFNIKCGNASWGETEEEFRKRIRNRKLILKTP